MTQNLNMVVEASADANAGDKNTIMFNCEPQNEKPVKCQVLKD